eukprot:5038473-Amphidinium_carterae.1
MRVSSRIFSAPHVVVRCQFVPWGSSLKCICFFRKGGRFMEIGKRGIWSHEQMKEARPDVMYEKIAADTMMEKESWRSGLRREESANPLRGYK